MFTKVKTEQEIDAIRESGRMLATVLAHLERSVVAGMSTADIDHSARTELQKLGGTPAFLGYQGFPSSICTSVNNEVVHGIPSETRIIAGGDIVSMDFGVKYLGMITDSALTMPIGGVSEKARRLITATKQSLQAGIDVIEDGVFTGTIGAAIQSVLENARLGIVRDLVGHGVGHNVHEDPNIPNYGTIDSGVALEAGMTIAIEPMATLGTDRVGILSDGWTVVTADDSLSAHFEHTVLITADGYEILTDRDQV